MKVQISDKFHAPGGGVSAAMSMRFMDQAPAGWPKGYVAVRRWRGPIGSELVEDRFLGWLDLGENLIVTVARKIMRAMISGAVPDSGATSPSVDGNVITNVSELFITNMRWGTAGHDPGNPTEPINPTLADTDLSAPLSSPTQKAVTVDYPTDQSVQFTAALDQTEANGEGLSEMGLFTNTHDLMFARKNFGLLTKTSDFTFEWRYIIDFS